MTFLKYTLQQTGEMRKGSGENVPAGWVEMPEMRGYDMTLRVRAEKRDRLFGSDGIFIHRHICLLGIYICGILGNAIAIRV